MQSMLLCMLIVSISSCSSTRRPTKKTKHSSLDNRETKLINRAKDFIGTPYKWGGNSNTGIDCSGLIYQSFKAIGQEVPRTTQELIRLGRKLNPNRLKPGDLVFFKTIKSKAKATHVGIITNHSKNKTLFIHSGTSTGVTISKLQDRYWKKRFVFARRLL